MRLVADGEHGADRHRQAQLATRLFVGVEGVEDAGGDRTQLHQARVMPAPVPPPQTRCTRPRRSPRSRGET